MRHEETRSLVVSFLVSFHIFGAENATLGSQKYCEQSESRKTAYL